MCCGYVFVMIANLNCCQTEPFVRAKESFCTHLNLLKKFYNCIQQQIRYNVISEIKYQLSCIEISKSDDASAKSSFDSAYHQIDYDNIKNSLEVKYRSVQRTNDYGGIIRVFNEKNISKSIGSFFGINNRDYCQIVIDLLRGIKHDEIVSALSPYLPTEIPR